MRTKNKVKNTSCHHQLPRNVCRRCKIDPSFNGNTIEIKIPRHQAYHALFDGNPPWIAKKLLKRETFHSAHKKIVENSLRNLFGNKTSFEQRCRTLDNLTPQMNYRIIYKLWSYGCIEVNDICHLLAIGKIRLNRLEQKELIEWLPEAAKIIYKT